MPFQAIGDQGVPLKTDLLGRLSVTADTTAPVHVTGFGSNGEITVQGTGSLGCLPMGAYDGVANATIPLTITRDSVGNCPALSIGGRSGAFNTNSWGNMVVVGPATDGSLPVCGDRGVPFPQDIMYNTLSVGNASGYPMYIRGINSDSSVTVGGSQSKAFCQGIYTTAQGSVSDSYLNTAPLLRNQGVNPWYWITPSTDVNGFQSAQPTPPEMGLPSKCAEDEPESKSPEDLELVVIARPK